MAVSLCPQRLFYNYPPGQHPPDFFVGRWEGGGGFWVLEEEEKEGRDGKVKGQNAREEEEVSKESKMVHEERKRGRKIYGGGRWRRK